MDGAGIGTSFIGMSCGDPSSAVLWWFIDPTCITAGPLFVASWWWNARSSIGPVRLFAGSWSSNGHTTRALITATDGVNASFIGAVGIIAGGLGTEAYPRACLGGMDRICPSARTTLPPSECSAQGHWLTR